MTIHDIIPLTNPEWVPAPDVRRMRAPVGLRPPILPGGGHGFRVRPTPVDRPRLGLGARDGRAAGLRAGLPPARSGSPGRLSRGGRIGRGGVVRPVRRDARPAQEPAHAPGGECGGAIGGPAPAGGGREKSVRPGPGTGRAGHIAPDGSRRRDAGRPDERGDALCPAVAGRGLRAAGAGGHGLRLPGDREQHDLAAGGRRRCGDLVDPLDADALAERLAGAAAGSSRCAGTFGRRAWRAPRSFPGSARRGRPSRSIGAWRRRIVRERTDVGRGADAQGPPRTG